VTLTPKGGKIPVQPRELEIVAADVLDPLGRPLAGNGTPGGNYVVVFPHGVSAAAVDALVVIGSLASGSRTAAEALTHSSRRRCRCAAARNAVFERNGLLDIAIPAIRALRDRDEVSHVPQTTPIHSPTRNRPCCIPQDVGR